MLQIKRVTEKGQARIRKSKLKMPIVGEGRERIHKAVGLRREIDKK